MCASGVCYYIIALVLNDPKSCTPTGTGHLTGKQWAMSHSCEMHADWCWPYFNPFNFFTPVVTKNRPQDKLQYRDVRSCSLNYEIQILYIILVVVLMYSTMI